MPCDVVPLFERCRVNAPCGGHRHHGRFVGELSILLTDIDKRVRDSAIEAIQEVDLRQPDWLEVTMLRFFELERSLESEYFAVGLANRVDRSTLDDLLVTAEASLDEHPGNPGALFLLAAARSD